MKTKLLFLIGILNITISYAQVGIGTVTPNGALDVTSTTDGLLIPRVILTATNIATVVTPTESELVYNTATAGSGATAVTPGFYYWDGTQWVRLETSGRAWDLLGNAGTDEDVNFLGTTDGEDLVFRTNNTENMRVNINGNVGIGTPSDLARLSVVLPDTDTSTVDGIYNEHSGSTSSGTYALYNYNNSSTNNAKYGIYNFTSNEGTGYHYGIVNYAYLNPGSTASAYGFYNYVNTNGASTTATNYGISNYLTSTAATGTHYGQRNYLYLNAASTANDYGEYTYVDYSSGTRYGEYKQMASHSSYDGDIYGDYNSMEGSGDGTTYGNFNNLAVTGTGIQYGVRNEFSGAGTGTRYGVRNEFSGVNGEKFGVYNYFPSGTETGTIYGIYNNISNDGPSAKIGTYNYISGGEGILRGSSNSIYPSSSNSSSIYGVYSYVSSAGTGTHYGLYSNTSGAGNYAAMFYSGNVVANEIGGDYDFRIETDNRDNALLVDASDDVVRFGSPTGNLFGNGTTYSSAGWTADADYVADFDIGTSRGTAVGIGSIEFLIDFESEATVNVNFSPTTDNLYDLGSSTNRWDDVWATNGTIQTSDKNDKTAITDLKYGLNEIMNLRPVTYKWKQNKKGDTFVPENEKDVHLGFIAQEVQKIVPEIVVDHNWRVTDEQNPNTYVKTKTARLGMRYQELVPVLIKAVQEQQAEIEDLKNEIKEIKRLLNTKQ